jgi:acetyl-CoA carboxylase carboxyl transferase subunit alpha
MSSMQLDFEKPITEIEDKITELTKLSADPKVDFSSEIAELKRKLALVKERVYANLTPWQTVQVARQSARPLIRDYIAGLCSEFLELHGDRAVRDDPGIIGGFATIDQHRVMLIGHQKGRTVEENIQSNFGMANPDGYRKALDAIVVGPAKAPAKSGASTPGDSMPLV